MLTFFVEIAQIVIDVDDIVVHWVENEFIDAVEVEVAVEVQTHIVAIPTTMMIEIEIDMGDVIEETDITIEAGLHLSLATTVSPSKLACEDQFFLIFSIKCKY